MLVDEIGIWYMIELDLKLVEKGQVNLKSNDVIVNIFNGKEIKLGFLRSKEKFIIFEQKFFEIKYI